MKKFLILLAILMVGIGAAVAQDEAAETTETDAPTVALSDQGFLVNSEGMTLYLFLNDTEGASTCFDACQVNWPPLLLDGELLAGEGLDQELLSTMDRPDGTTHVLYAGWPLYYYVADMEPGDTAGQGVGDVWYVVDAEGNQMELAAE